MIDRCPTCGEHRIDARCFCCEYAREFVNLPDLRLVENQRNKTPLQKAIEAAQQERNRKPKILCYEGSPRFYRLVQHVTNYRMIGSPNITPIVDEIMEEVEDI